MTAILTNEQAFPVFLDNPISTDTNTGLFTSLLIGIIPVLLAGLLSAPASPATTTCPLTTPCPVTSPCPAITPCQMTTPCPVTTPCPPAPQCEPIPACPESYIQLTNGGVPIENRCFYFSNTQTRFRGAIVGCAILGGSLFNIQTTEEGLAVKAYLSTEFPSTSFWAGYTDFEADGSIIGLSGGLTTPVVPGYGALPSTTSNQDCVSISENALSGETCTNTYRYICDINLATQKCVCPP